jgi:hypothetical protein
MQPRYRKTLTPNGVRVYTSMEFMPGQSGMLH